MINAKCLPIGVSPTLLQRGATSFNTLAGVLVSNRFVSLNEIMLPEFDKAKKIDSHHALVFDSDCQYDMILGRDFLQKIGFKFNFESHTMQWLENIVSMKTPDFWTSSSALFDVLDDTNDEIFPTQHFESFKTQALKKLLDSDYKKVDIADVVTSQKHLTSDQQAKLANVLIQYTSLFDGTLGHYPNYLAQVELLPNSTPTHAKPYPIPRIHIEAFKKELAHLVQIGVLRPCGPTEWACPTFVTPKNDGRIRWVSDLRVLNKSVKRSIYPLPNIQDILAKRSGYQFFTKLDLTMMYYAIELDDNAKELCTIVTPFGKFQYCRLPMGLKSSPDIAQSIIEGVLSDLDVDVYIDDIGIFSNDYDSHLEKIGQVLSRLEASGFKIIPSKCEWCVKETDFLGYWLTPTGIKPWRKKVDAILKMQRPTDVKQLRSFLGAVTYYRHMWPRRSHLLAPLTQLTGKSKFEWSDACEHAFLQMKSVLATDALLSYPDHNLPSHVYTDASDYQLGAAIIQNGRPVAYWSRKLTPAQSHYTTMEKELLAVVLCLKEFRTMLLGSQITVFTDHRNLTFKTLSPQRVLRWRLYLEDYHPTFKYIQGKENVLADCFSRLPRMERP